MRYIAKTVLELAIGIGFYFGFMGIALYFR